MMSFAEFYEALLRFVNFKLYKDAGLEYPPKVLDPMNLAAGATFSLIQPFIHQTQTQLQQKRAAAGPDQEQQVNKSLDLFKPFRFFLNREVPLYSLEFVLLSAGCQLGFLGEGSAFDESAEGITHQIVDRPNIPDMRSNREYVQPQWVYDCLNHSIILPTSAYVPGKVLPAHLSPFVDNAREGYIPTRQKEISQMKGIEEEPMEVEEESEDDEGDVEEKKELAHAKNVDEDITDEENEKEEEAKDKLKKLKVKK